MLARLYIKDFALIEEVAIEFGPDLNIITGETGAGKSIPAGRESPRRLPRRLWRPLAPDPESRAKLPLLQRS